MTGNKNKQTEKHLVLLDFIKEFQTEHGYIPSFDEIIKNTPIKSKSHISFLLKKLEALGLLERQPRQARSINLTQPNNRMLKIPLFGRIAAGIPILLPGQGADTLRPEDELDIPAAYLPRLPAGSEVFALRVKGDSMIDAAILDGDVVILKRVQDPTKIKKDDIVAAWLIKEESTTIKRYERQADGTIWLVPEHPDREKYKPLIIRNPAEELDIQGILVSVIRSYPPRRTKLEKSKTPH